ncbi:hypothetical protein [Thalassobellus citreus]|uniref:hypothetical protein n=1 Tax=Thalassobellus citreus TaxID=3367752 RepID=UPI0037B9F6E3
MHQILNRTYVVIICLFSMHYSFSQNPDFKNLEVVFVKKVDAYSKGVISNNSMLPTGNTNPYTELKFKIRNTGKSTIILNLNEIYALDRFKNRYPIEFSTPLSKTKIKLKAFKTLKKTFKFDIPHNQEPVMLLVEDRIFQMYL